MLRCPKCNRTYQDDMQKFCTHDGGRLVPDVEKPKAFDPNATVHTDASSIGMPSSDPSVPSPSQDLDATITGSPPSATTSAPSTSAIPASNTAPTPFPSTTKLEQTPSVPASYPPPPQATQSEALPPASMPLPSPSVPLPSQPQSAPLPSQPAPVAAAAGKSKFRLMLGVVGALVLIIIVGGGAAVYFIFIKEKGPRRGRSIAEEPTLKDAENTNTGPALEAKPKPAEAPSGTLKFVNSPSTLDGKLAAQYVDFYFFYPQTWEKSKSAGVPGAANFVEVERKIPPDFTQEKLVVSWYESKGTVDADLKGKLPALIRERNASQAKVYPEYQKVSEGRTTINGIEGYEFRFKAASKGTEKGDLNIWGRVVFLPSGDESSTRGVTLYMLTTSLAPELKGVDDVGVKGVLPVILNSFTLGKS